jgi:cyclic lactone autoinducer peptide
MKFLMKYSSVIAGFALMVTKINIHTNCMYFLHQPKLPNGAEKLRKL